MSKTNQSLRLTKINRKLRNVTKSTFEEKNHSSLDDYMLAQRRRHIF